MPHRHIEISQTGIQGVTHEDHENVKIHRLYEDHHPIDKFHHMMTWFGEIHGGEPVLGHFSYPTVVYITEGEFYVEDKSKPDQITKLVAGDVIHIDEASYINWSSPNGGTTFGVAYAPTNAHPEDIIRREK